MAGREYLRTLYVPVFRMRGAVEIQDEREGTEDEVGPCAGGFGYKNYILGAFRAWTGALTKNLGEGPSEPDRDP